ncbi:uncharacterized protein LOC126828243 [Patella vulgata]|uniref:uncharacterized protein LOC126828243 n=1 Tax=Patella vulgata TaxID=6465 RepID=UPI0024A810B3|nr:uncharacterized protein LOC126828243 [Patella vulgata]
MARYVTAIFICVAIGVVQSKDESVILWKNNDFPVDNPLKFFNPATPGLFTNGSLSCVKDPAGSGQNVIRVFYKNGTYSQDHYSKGLQFYSEPTQPQLALTLTYDIYFEPNFDFAMGGKLPGMFGGGLGICSGGRHSNTCFSARLMWRADGYGEIYTYIPDQGQGFCDRVDVICFPLKGTSLGRGMFRYPRGVWTTVTEHVHLNTVGFHDGFAKIWLNGSLAYIAEDIMWRVTDELEINGLFFSTFFGGGEPIWAARKDNYSYFKNFTFSLGAEPPLY